VEREPEPQPGDPPPESPGLERPADSEFEFRTRLAIRRFRDLPEALLAKGSLVSAGIDCALIDENMVRMDWFWSNLMGGIKLLVDADQASDAAEVLDEPIPEHLEVSGIGNFEQPRCPKCGSLDINFREIHPELTPLFSSTFQSRCIVEPGDVTRAAWNGKKSRTRAIRLSQRLRSREL